MSAQINLFNPALGKKKLAFSALEMSQMLGIVLLGVLAITWYLNYQASQLESQVAVSQEQFKLAQGQLSKVTAEYTPRSKNKQLESDIAALEIQVRALEKVADLLKRGDFGNAKGYSAYLTAFARQSQEGLWLTDVGVSASGKELSLSGRTLQADLVPKYVQRLAAEPVLRGKSFGSLDMQRLGDGATPNGSNGSNGNGNNGSANGSNNTAGNTGAVSATSQPGLSRAQSDAASQALLAQAGKLGAALGQSGLNQFIAPLLKTTGVAGSSLPGVPASGQSAPPANGPVRPAPGTSGAPGVRGPGATSSGSAVIEFHLSARGAEGEHK